MTRRTASSRSRGSRGFTLIEVMISMALVLGLILGINAVFKMAADTVGMGQALSAKMRDSRAAQTVFYNDVSHAVLASDRLAFLLIDSRTQSAFRDARDRESDQDYDASATPANQDAQIRTIDIDGNNKEGELPNVVAGELISPAAVNERAHRLDTLSFCARDLFRRQTGNYGTYVADMASSEAWITYGHGRVFDQSGDVNLDDPNHYLEPGYPVFPTAVSTLNPAPLNAKNFYASDWVLLRQVMLLVPPSPPQGQPNGYPSVITRLPNTLPLAQQDPQAFWFRQQNAPLDQLQPLGRQTPVQDPTNNTPNTTVITDARYDLIGTSIGDTGGFRDILADYVEHSRYHMLGAMPQTPNVANDAWWDILASGPRFRCNPYPQKPLDSRKAAQMSSVLVGNCSQFIVEFAGDYLTQDNNPASNTYGDLLNLGPDGTIDYFVEKVPAGGTNTIPVVRTRWYGYPRDANGDGIIVGQAQAATPAPKKHNELVDVVPLRDVVLSANPNYYNNITNNKAAWDLVRFERALFTSGGITNTLQNRANYADPTNGVQPGERYVAAWTPNDVVVSTATGTWSLIPKMLRVIIRSEDPGGKLAEGHTSEYVIKLP